MNGTFLVVNKETGHNDKKNRDWFKVSLVCIASDDCPILVGKVLDKFCEEEFYADLAIDPTKAISLDFELRTAYNPAFADLHLSVNLVDDMNS